MDEDASGRLIPPPNFLSLRMLPSLRLLRYY